MSTSTQRGQPALDGADRREHPRVLTLRTARLSWNGQEEPIHCAILDVSAGGVRILVPEDAKVPVICSLEIDEPPGPPHKCRVMWRASAKLGLQFED